LADTDKSELSLQTTTTARIAPTTAFLNAAAIFVVADIIAPQVVNMVLLGGFLVLVLAAAIRGSQGNLQGVSGSMIASCGKRLRGSPMDWLIVVGITMLVTVKIAQPDALLVRRFTCLAILLLGFQSASKHLRRRSKRKPMKSGRHPIVRFVHELIGHDALVVPEGVELMQNSAEEEDERTPGASAWTAERRERYSDWLSEEIKRFNNEYEADTDAAKQEEEPEAEAEDAPPSPAESADGMPSNVLRVTSRNNDD
jgi:hypothetical protein